MNIYEIYESNSSQDNSEDKVNILSPKDNNNTPNNTDKSNLNIKEENKSNITDFNFNKKDNLYKNKINIKANNDNSNLIDDVKDIKFNLYIEIANEIFYDNKKYIIAPKQPKNENIITYFC